MIDDRDKGDDEEGGNGSSGAAGAGQPLVPNFGGRHRDGESHSDPQRFREEEPTVPREDTYPSLDDRYVPDINDFGNRETLPNGFILAFDGKVWGLFDDDEKFIGTFDDREDAIETARNMKPFPGLGM